jgi:lysozyme
MYTITDNGLNVIRSFEGRALRAYQDSVGVWTIGYGNTNYDANAVKKIGKIQKGLTITPEQAEELFVESIAVGYEPAVRETLSGKLEGEKGQWAHDAGTGFHYNTGAVKKASWPKSLLAGNLADAKLSIQSWNKAGGKVLAGLTRRRNREWAIITTGDYGPEGRQGPVEIGENGRPTGKQLPPPAHSAALPAPVTPGAVVVPPGILYHGSSGPEVTELTEQLVALGRLKQPYDIYADEVEAAVKKYQGEHPNLTVDGRVGPATRAQIMRDLDARAKVKTVSKSTVVVGGVASAASAFGWGSLKLAGILAGSVVAVGLIIIVMQHRTEIVTAWNRLLGKQVA